ncbi:MAG: asparagine synthase (glutamine-hydrolyzing) [Chitinophagaceae bacterium]
MCRIAGIYDPTIKDLEERIIGMRDTMHRGGPDDFGVYVDESLPLALGHRRLSLLDLSSAGHQPMHDLEKNIAIIFNGEIYNFLEIREVLISLGYRFITQTDTEVIIYAYLQWGPTCFSRFNGMFALAIFDQRNKQIILARDHAGIKPLYYHLSQNRLVFASEIRAFSAFDLNWPENSEWKIPFLTFGHLPEPFTTLKNVEPLEKGTCLIIQLPSLTAKKHVFNKFKFTNTVTDLVEAVELIRNKLEGAVERHLISDAPIGLFLSGGVDSSLLTLLANKYIKNNLRTLSIIFEDATLNEEPYQKIIADKTKAHHHSFLVTENEFGQSLPDILQAMDQPSTDGINSYFISKYAKQYGLTAVLSGLGADELFGGYKSFNRTNQSELIGKLPSFLTGLISNLASDKYKKIAFLKKSDLTSEYLFNRGFFTPMQVAGLLGFSETEVNNALNKVRIEALPLNIHPKNKVSWLESNFYMQNQLLKDTDYMSMWHSIEVRVPFLDKELMQAAYSISPDIKYDPVIGKHLLIKAFNDLLPFEIWQRKKMGFTFPFYKWLNNISISAPSNKHLEVAHKYRKNNLHWSKYWASVLTEQGQVIYTPKKKLEEVLH